MQHTTSKKYYFGLPVIIARWKYHEHNNSKKTFILNNTCLNRTQKEKKNRDKRVIAASKY